MRKLILVFALMLAVNINAQVAVQPAKANLVTEVSFPKDQPVDVRLLHPDLDKGTEEYLKAHPNGLLQNRLGKASWTFTVSSTYTWQGADLTTAPSYTPYSVPSTCRAVGTHCYIFVEDANWNVRVTQAQVNAIENAFDNSTPANAAKGIYQTDVETFGNPPDVDGDPRIIILIMDIRDGYTPGNAYTAGYFFSRDQTNNTGSNHAEIYYLDCNPLDLTANLSMAMQTTAHEFQHMIHYNYQHGNQTTFLNEGCSLVAELVNGYTFREQSSFANDTPQGLFVWRTGNDVLKDYSRAARFMLYFYDQLGVQFLGKFVQSAYAGITGIDDALSKLTTTTSRRFADILPDWYIANAVDNAAFNPKWGYTLVTNMPKPQGYIYGTANVSATTLTVPYLGVQIISHLPSVSLSSTFSNGTSTYQKIKAIKLSSGSPVVEDVTFNSAYNISPFSGTYSEAQYLVVNSNITTDLPFTYTSTGTNATTNEIKYDTESSVYVYNWSAGTKLAVIFDQAIGCRINAVRVGMRNNANPLSLEVYKYSGDYTKPLSTKLLSAMSVTNPNSTASWVSVPLSTQNVSLNDKTVVVFTMATSVPNGGNTVLTEQKSTLGFSNSVNSSDGTNFNWYADGSLTLLNKIRIVAESATGVEDLIELMPSSYSLSQNYPNPFNPSTKIKFSLPEAAKVTVRIYDMLGRDIKTLVNTEQTAGSHEVTWNGDNDMGQKVASGIYMYAISTSKFVQTKKMVLLK